MKPDLSLTQHRIKVLLIDDQPIIVEKIRQMLSSESDIDFQACTDPSEAIKTANQVSPTLILQDLVMPGIEGLTLVKYFRVNPSTREVPIIVLSSTENPQTKARAFHLGANDYMVKFPDHLEVIARIRYHSRAYINLLEKNEACARLSVLVNNEQERSRELALLAEMSELLHGCGKEADTYTILKDIYCRLLPFASGSIAIFDTTSERFEIAEAWGESFCSGEAFEKQDCLAMRRFQMHTVNEPDKSTTCAHISSTAAACYLCQPIISQSEPIGVICLGIHRNCLNEDEPDIKKKFTAKQSIIGRMAEFYTLSLINFRLCDTLRMRSLHDPLTGLYNRRYMEQTLNREIDRAKRNHCHLGVAMLDIDHFKTFNDTYGHDVGDLILRRLGTHLLDSIRTTDIACRYGGEEFLLIMGDISLQNLAHKIETLLAGIKNELKIEHDNQLLSVTISAGIGCFPDHGESIEEIIKAADQSLYRAKANGRDRLEIAPVPSDVSEKQDNALPGGSVPGI